MGVELINDEDPIGFRICIKGLLDVFFKIVFRASLTQCWTNDLSCGHFKIRNQATGALPDVFKLLVFDPTRLHWKRLMGTFLCLYACFFIRTNKVDPLVLKRKRLFIKRADRLALLIKGFFIHIRWAFPIAYLMRFKIRLLLKNDRSDERKYPRPSRVL